MIDLEKKINDNLNWEVEDNHEIDFRDLTPFESDARALESSPFVLGVRQYIWRIPHGRDALSRANVFNMLKNYCTYDDM